MNTNFSNDENVAIVYAVNMILMNAGSEDQEDIDRACEQFTYEEAKNHCYEPWNRDFLCCDSYYELHMANDIFLDMYMDMVLKNIKIKIDGDENEGKMSVEVNDRLYEVEFTNCIGCETDGYELFFRFSPMFEHQWDGVPNRPSEYIAGNNLRRSNSVSFSDSEDDSFYSLSFSDEEDEDDDYSSCAAPAA